MRHQIPEVNFRECGAGCSLIAGGPAAPEREALLAPSTEAWALWSSSESPTDAGEPPALPIFKTCSEDPFDPSGGVPGAEVIGERETAPVGPSTPRISIVDDDEEMQLFLKDLEAQGHFKIAGSFY